MKKLLLCFLLLAAGAVNAQIVNIPDANFKAALLSTGTGNIDIIAQDSSNYNIAIDTNGDGEIQLSEAQAVWNLTFENFNITSLTGIEAFSNLRIFRPRENPITNIDVSMLAHLEEFNAGHYSATPNYLNSINVQGLSNLKTIVCDITILPGSIFRAV